MTTTVYNCRSYLECLQLKYSENQKKRGYLKQLAKAANCQPSFISQIMREKTHLTPDHASGIADFWGLDGGETEYFLHLVLLERSGSKKHREYCRGKLEKLKKAHTQIGQRVSSRKFIKFESQSKYYSDWSWALIHIMTSVPQYQTATAISERLNLSVNRVNMALTELTNMGLVAKIGSKWEIGVNRLHLDKDSPFNTLNQRNFRFFMFDQLSRKSNHDLHFSAVYGLGAQACSEIKENILRLIAETDKKVLLSEEEEIACLTLDFVTV